MRRCWPASGRLTWPPRWARSHRSWPPRWKPSRTRPSVSCCACATATTRPPATCATQSPPPGSWARTTGDSYALGRVLHAIATIHHYRGELAEALRLFDEARALKRQVGDVQGVASSDQSRALTLRALGRVDEALEILEQLVTSPVGHAEPWARAIYLDSYATTLLIAGRGDEAVPPLREALDLARRTGGLFEPTIEQHLAMALLVLGEPDLAEQVAARPLPDGREMLDVQLQARLLRCLVLLHRREIPAVLAAADELARWMAATGVYMYRGLPTRLAATAADPPPPAELPRLLLRHD